jgi:prepilin-type N-terminal cleavage/methylation domain-containing protein
MRGSVTTAERPGARRAQRGFSLIELLVTVTLAGIIFVAMVPMFVSVLKGTSTNERRVIATNLGQARLEDARMLGYSNLTAANMASNFGSTFEAAHGGAPYNVTYSVAPGPTSSASPSPAYKTVTVSVSRSGDNFTTTVSTVVMNPAVLSTAIYSSMGGGGGPYSVTAAFKSSAEVKRCYITQYVMNTALATPSPTATVNISPTQQPSASPTTSTVQWTGLPGGMGYLYIVWCLPQSPSTWSTVLQTPQFHLLSNGWVKFDTNPGGS